MWKPAWYIAGFIVLGVLAYPMGTSAQTQESPAATDAEKHLARGIAHYEAREFEAAIREFLAGYESEPRPAFLFALGQAERRSGDCESALIYYQRFIASQPPADQVRAARMHIDGCRAALASGPGDTTGDATRDADTPNRVETAETAKKSAARPVPIAFEVVRPEPWYHDVPGDILLGTGAMSALVGIGLIAKSYSASDRATWAATYPEYDMHLAQARRYRTWGAVALTASTVLAAGAVYRFHHRPREQSPTRRDSRDIGIAPARGGLTFLYGGRF